MHNGTMSPLVACLLDQRGEKPCGFLLDRVLACWRLSFEVMVVGCTGSRTFIFMLGLNGERTTEEEKGKTNHAKLSDIKDACRSIGFPFIASNMQLVGLAMQTDSQANLEVSKDLQFVNHR